ncbi:MAG TPA: NAD(P)H-dependent oxidoreductase subunit E [Vicinamibacterales bacterium]|nr:NAD(P)H-dependent oxidoreductase subunit E [Vicinamibacterales bacterium]
MSFHPLIRYPEELHRSRREVLEPGEPFAFTPERRARLDELAARYPPDRRRSLILPALWLAQEQQGYVTAGAVRHIAEVIGCTPAEVDDALTYYTMFHRRPVGRFVLAVCRTLPCALCGAERLTEAIARRLGIDPGETDPTGTFTLLEVECLGACDRAPVVMVNNEHWHECADPEAVDRLLDDLRARGEAALSGCHLRERPNP